MGTRSSLMLQEEEIQEIQQETGCEYWLPQHVRFRLTKQNNRGRLVVGGASADSRRSLTLAI